MIWGEKTTTQQAIDIDLQQQVSRMLRPRMDMNAYPQIPEIASTSRFNGPVGGAILGEGCQKSMSQVSV